MAEPAKTGLDRRRQRRLIAAGLLRAALTTVVLVMLYYALPLDETMRLSTGLRLAVGLVIFAAVAAWQIRAILRSKYPGVRAIEGLAFAAPLFLLIFASTYFLMAASSSGNFSEAMTRTDALYFTVTTFATVGFGDITATSEAARVLVTVQMILDLLLLGLGIRAFIGAARLGRQRLAASDDQRPDRGKDGDPTGWAQND